LKFSKQACQRDQIELELMLLYFLQNHNKWEI
jgi:hypothetical protein